MLMKMKQEICHIMVGYVVSTNPQTLEMTKKSQWTVGVSKNSSGELLPIKGLVKGEKYHVVETAITNDDVKLDYWDWSVSNDNVFTGGETATITNTFIRQG